ncbi:MAG: hypothetical protein MJ069_10415 [Salinivirgaceae bacterium]|nr:hypothetical protein [Salinivirgaceae bacterium]
MKRIVFMALLMVSVVSCKKDQSRDSILGVWHCEENRSHSSSGFAQYSVTILNDPEATDTSMFVFSNLYQMGVSTTRYVHFTLNGNVIEIPYQELDNQSVEGEGTIESDFSKINLKYTVTTSFADKVVSTLK